MLEFTIQLNTLRLTMLQHGLRISHRRPYRVGGTNFSVSGCRVKVPEQCCHRLATAIAIRHCDTHLARRVCVRRYITDNWTTYRNTGTALPSLHAATHTPLCLFQENSSAFSQPCPNLRSLSPSAPDCPNHGPPHPTLSNLLPFHPV